MCHATQWLAARRNERGDRQQRHPAKPGKATVPGKLSAGCIATGDTRDDVIRHSAKRSSSISRASGGTVIPCRRLRRRLRRSTWSPEDRTLRPTRPYLERTENKTAGTALAAVVLIACGTP